MKKGFTKSVGLILNFSSCKVQELVLIAFAILYFFACDNFDPYRPERPMDPWAFRSVLDKHPRMLTLALDSACYVAYDLARCTLLKAWKGGVTLEGAAYTDKKNVQPSTWGKSYFSDSLHRSNWIVEEDGEKKNHHMVSKGYAFHQNQITLRYELFLSSGDTIYIEEQPEFIRSKTGKPGLERLFKTSHVPDGVKISVQSADNTFTLNSNKKTRVASYFNSLPEQIPPKPEAEYDHRGRYWIEKSDCMTCHEADRKTVGPSFQQIAQRYPNEKKVIQYLIRKIKEGSVGVWESTVMNPHPKLTENEIKIMLDYILSLKPAQNKKVINVIENKKAQAIKTTKPGFGAPLEGVHPSYEVSTIHKKDFKPRVGGLAFLPDGRLLVTTWDAIGAVYLLDGVETGDTNKIKVKRIASGLAEPLGIEVVNGEIFVLQKQELTRLIDQDGDDLIDVYEAVCNRWGVTGDFHEFAFGLIFKDGHFYATLSLAMRLMSHEKQQPDRGRTIRISRDGSYESINYGLRTPNGIGLGIDNEIFVTDNQGEWVPGNKLIHVKKGEYHGMRWGLPDSLPETTPIALPAIWLPEDEIGNSPSEPVLMQDGPYKGQMLHGDVTHGGIKRDFLEKINGAYQGAVFRFTQGLEAGVNRLRWGPDGALYIGGVGMVGGWSWKEKQYGLQRMKYNGNLTFEMLAVRAKAKGFEIEFTEPLEKGREIRVSEFLVHQWCYLPTANYGGPKMDLEKLKVTRINISKDRSRVYLEIPELKKEHVVYFRLPENLQSVSGQSLWSSEAWYTLNNIPE
ncbi:MAG: c-type cytochrome [Saprospiraceae bacterium]|nr:c-type cytochrome [Saprospiraceae bacterium]